MSAELERLTQAWNTAVLHRWQGEGTFAGQSFEDDHRCTMVCVRRDGKWRIALEHCSPNGA